MVSRTSSVAGIGPSRAAMATAAAAMILAVLPNLAAGANEIGFVEDFALAADRAKALQQLIPGTEDYYYYHCLHYQNLGQFDEVQKVLTDWIRRHGRTPRVVEIENRQALLQYAKSNQATLDYVIRKLDLQFNHQRELLDQPPNLPTELDLKLISRETLTQRALAGHADTVGGFEDSALDWLVAVKLDGNRWRDLLRRIARPDHAGLCQLILDDLSYQGSGGFGSLPIHGRLLLGQLEELVKARPGLLNETNFVNAWLLRLRPGADEDWRHDPKSRQAYLDRLWEFAQRLAPVHNSLKAHVLHHRLVHDRAMGVYDKPRFMTYIQLPRDAHYMNPEYLRREDSQRYRAQLGADYSAQTMLPPIGDDEPIIRDFLMRVFVEEDSWEPYATWLRDTYLKRVFAETKIVSGIGDMEKWASMLSAGEFQALKDRIDLDFSPTNKVLLAPEDAVSLDLFVKNVQKLLVKVYEINAMNYYCANPVEVNTDINLDGLVANEELEFKYDAPPLRRHRETFQFPKLNRRGLYVVEFIGNGISSRALIRKGRLRFLVRNAAAGHAFTVLDEASRKLPKAGVWLAGHEYRANEDGEVVVPYSTSPAGQPVVLFDGEFASLESFQHLSEQYALSAAFHVDRESLRKGGKAVVAVRAVLLLNGTPVALSLLEDVTLLVGSADLDNVRATKEVPDFKLVEGKETEYEFKVPDRLQSVAFQLKAKVKSISQNRKVDLSAATAFQLNGIDRTEKTEDLHLLCTEGRYILELLGKTGEAKPDRPVNITLKHRDFRDPVHASLKTDASGRVFLGDLADIVTLSAAGPQGTSHQWLLDRDQHSLPATIHGKAGEAIHVPYMGRAAECQRSELSLLELRDGQFYADRFSSLAIKDGFLVVQDLPAGDYSLLLKDFGRQIHIRLTEGDRQLGYVLSANRHLEVRNAQPLQISAVTADAEAMKVRLRNAGPSARVHVIATRYVEAFPVWGYLGSILFREPSMVIPGKGDSAYVSGRNIGDEYRYILERKYGLRFPGNMLNRPGLLLNPWAVRQTETGAQEAKAGEAWGRGEAPRASFGGAGAAGRAPIRQAGDFANLDFLAEPPTVVLNLAPDKEGVVTIPRKALGDRRCVHILAADQENTAYRRIALAEAKLATRDLRLALGLKPDAHFTEQKQISVAAKGKEFIIEDAATGRMEAYDSLAKVYALYATLSNDPKLAEFSFIITWPKLKPQDKLAKYSEFACHELSFFLSKKDPEFFRTVILPYLRNKKDKTFLDHWLLGDDLSEYLKPWAHARLNVVERILLAQRIKGEVAHTARHVGDLHDLIPPDIDRMNHLFDTALKGSSLETADVLGFEKAMQQAERLSTRARRAGGRGGAGAEEAEERLGEIAAVPEPAVAVRAPTVAIAGAGKPALPAGPAAAPAAPPAPAPPSDRPALAQAAEGARRLEERADRAKAVDELRKAAAKADVDKNGALDLGVLAALKDAKTREAAAQLYRKLDKTQEWAENNYYKLPIEQQGAELVAVNGFWRDYARWTGGEFLSPNFAEAGRNFTEMMLALAVLDLPFEPAKHDTKAEAARFTLAPGGAILVCHKEIKAAAAAPEKTPILISQNLYRHDDRYLQVGNERIDKYITEEFLVHTVYGCQVVITNPTSSRQRLDVLLQVPLGAMAVLGGKDTRSVPVDLAPYSTQTLEYHFYFPAKGLFDHYPVHVAKNEKLVASAPPAKLNVVDKLTKIDKTAWVWISQHGTPEEVLAFLRDNNINRIELAKIAWRMREKDFFAGVLALLAQRHVYDHTLWSYALRHNDVPGIREYLQHRDDFVAQCGAWLDSPLLTIDPVVRRAYQHLEYSPLVNARAHQLGKRRTILNDRLFGQYHQLMAILACRPKLDDDDLMAITYYMLLQDRVEEAVGFFARVAPQKLATRIQHDYLTAYLDFLSDKPAVARKTADKYRDWPVDRWRKAFAAMSAQLDEIEGKAPAVADEQDRTQLQTKLAAAQPSLDFKVESRKVILNYQSIQTAAVSYYLMDIELLFSRNPFVQEYSGQFAYIRPNATEELKLPADRNTFTFDLPQKFHSSNVMVQIEAAGVRKAQAYFANSLNVQVIENYGQVKVAHAQTGKPLPKVYVKAYARMKDGQVRFYKDGYTDLRGRFEYTSLNTNELDFAEKFSLLVLSDEFGAVVREAAPPKQ